MAELLIRDLAWRFNKQFSHSKMKKKWQGGEKKKMTQYKNFLGAYTFIREKDGNFWVGLVTSRANPRMKFLIALSDGEFENTQLAEKLGFVLPMAA